MSADRELRIRLLMDAMDKASGPLRAIKAESAKAAKEIRGTAESLSKLKRSQEDLKGFRDLKTGLQQTKRELSAAEEKAKKLGKALASTEQPTKKMQAEFKRAAAASADLQRKYEGQHRELAQARDRLQAAGVSTRNLTQDERKLATQVAMTTDKLKAQERQLRDLDSSAPRRLQEMQAGMRVDRDIENVHRQRMDRLKDRLSVAGAIIGTATAVAGVDAVKGAAAFENQMTSIAQKANITRTQAERVGRLLNALAPEVAQMPADMADAMNNLAGKGLFNQLSLDPSRRMAELERLVPKMMRPIGRLATAYEAEMNDVAGAAYAASRSLNIPLEQTQRVLDMMAAADNAGSFEVKDMAGELPTLTAAARALGMEGPKAFKSLLAALETAAMGAGGPAEAANNVNNLLAKINTKETVDNFRKMGVDLPAALKRMYAEGRTPIEAITALTEKTLKGDLSKISYLFGDMQAQRALIPLIQFNREYQRIAGEIERSNGTIDKALAEREKNTTTKWQKFTATWEAMQASWGKKALSPVVNPVLDFATATLRRLEMKATAEGRKKLLEEDIRAGRRLRRAPRSGQRPQLSWNRRPTEQAPQISRRQRTTDRPILLAPRPPAPRAVQQSVRKPTAIAFPATVRPPLLRPSAGAGTEEAERRVFARVAAIRAAAGQADRKHLEDVSARGDAAMQQAVGRAAQFRAQMKAQGQSSYFDLRSVGAYSMLGLAHGMEAQLPALKQRAISLATTVRDFFKRTLRIQSPSRVFVELGQYVTSGLALGLDRGSEEPIAQVRRLAASLAAAGSISLPTPAFAANDASFLAGRAQRNANESSPRQFGFDQPLAPADRFEDALRRAESSKSRATELVSPPAGNQAAAAAARHAGDHYEIHVYPSAGMDEEALARLVDERLRASQRRSLGNNAAFGDRPDWSDSE